MIDLRKERAKRTGLAQDWTVEEVLEDCLEKLRGDHPLSEADAVIIVFSKRYPDGSSSEHLYQGGTRCGNEAIGMLQCSIKMMME